MTYEFADKELENRFHKYCQKYNVDLINPDYVLLFSSYRFVAHNPENH